MDLLNSPYQKAKATEFLQDALGQAEQAIPESKAMDKILRYEHHDQAPTLPSDGPTGKASTQENRRIRSSSGESGSAAGRLKTVFCETHPTAEAGPRLAVLC